MAKYGNAAARDLVGAGRWPRLIGIWTVAITRFEVEAFPPLKGRRKEVWPFHEVP